MAKGDALRRWREEQQRLKGEQSESIKDGQSEIDEAKPIRGGFVIKKTDVVFRLMQDGAFHVYDISDNEIPIQKLLPHLGWSWKFNEAYPATVTVEMTEGGR